MRCKTLSASELPVKWMSELISLVSATVFSHPSPDSRRGRYDRSYFAAEKIEATKGEWLLNIVLPELMGSWTA